MNNISKKVGFIVDMGGPPSVQRQCKFLYNSRMVTVRVFNISANIFISNARYMYLKTIFKNFFVKTVFKIVNGKELATLVKREIRRPFCKENFYYLGQFEE